MHSDEYYMGFIPNPELSKRGYTVIATVSEYTFISRKMPKKRLSKAFFLEKCPKNNFFETFFLLRKKTSLSLSTFASSKQGSMGERLKPAHC